MSVFHAILHPVNWLELKPEEQPAASILGRSSAETLIKVRIAIRNNSQTPHTWRLK